MTASLATREEMLAAIPSLRAFALSLCRNRNDADDLVKETILRAWANRDRFAQGTNLHAWLFTILRNFYYSESRKTRRSVEDPDGSYAASLASPPEQHGKCDLRDFRTALATLPARTA